MTRRQLRKQKHNMHDLPVYKAAYDCYKECRFRFRTVTKDCKATAHEVLRNLLEIMVDIELVYWQVEPRERLAETYRLVLKTLVILRAMHDAGELSTQHFCVISKYSADLSKNMGNWNVYYNNKTNMEESGEENRQIAVDS